MKRTVFFLIISCLFLLLSCSSMDVRTFETLLPLTDVYQEGAILFYDYKDAINLSENDIGIKIKYHEKIEQFYSVFEFNCNKTDKIKTTVYNNGKEYTVFFKYINDGYFKNPFSVKARIKQKGYKINTVDPVTLTYRGLRANADVYKFQLPIELTYFKINNKRFTLVGTTLFCERGRGLYLYTGKDQKFLIVDKTGNIYASFTNDRYELNVQPDSDKYDFIPVIASYIVIRQILSGEKL